MKKTVLFYSVLSVLTLCFAGCFQPVMNLVESDPLIYSIELRRNGNVIDAYSPVIFLGETEIYDPLEISIINTGNQPLTGLQLYTRGDNAGDFEIPPLGSGVLAPNESTSFKVTFSPKISAGGVYRVEILVGSGDAGKILGLEYTAYELEALQSGASITFSEPYLQAGTTPFAKVSTTDTDKNGVNSWFSSNPGAAYFDENDNEKLLVAGPGETTIYFVTLPAGYKAKGKKVTVYPAIKTLNPVYPLEEGFVMGVDKGAPVLPVNLQNIQDAAAGGHVTFTLTDGAAVISTIDSATGALTFSGTTGDTAPAGVNLKITKTLSGGADMVTHSGAVSFTVKIVPPKPGPVIQSAVIDGANRADAKNLVITYNKMPVLTNLDGFSIGNAKEGSFFFSGYRVSGNTLIITLDREPAWPEILANKLTLTYNAGTGNVKDDAGNRGDSASGFSILIQNFDPAAYTPPQVIAMDGIVLDGNSPTRLVITWDKILDAVSGYAGFTLTGAEGLNFAAATVNGASLILTMDRAPNQIEAQGGLSLSYKALNSGPVKDSNGSAAESFTGKPVTVKNPDRFLAAPALQSVLIHAANPKNLALTFDKPVRAASPAGFSISGSATATTFTGVSGSGTTSLTLTLNRKPAYGETLLLSYNQSAGNVALNADSTIVLPGFTGKGITLDGFNAANDSRPAVVSVIINADKNGDSTPTPAEAKVIAVTFDKAVNASNASGFTVSGSVTALDIMGISGSGTSTLELTLDDWPSKSESKAEGGKFTLSYNMDLGNVCDHANNANLLPGFNEAVIFQNFGGAVEENTDSAPPRLVSAVVENANPSVIRVAFNEPVAINKAKFYVKVNDIPCKTMAVSPPSSGILLDLQNRSDRTITGVAEVGGTNKTAWDMTMSAPAVHGEILRLAADTAGAAEDLAAARNPLPAIPQFIVNNRVKRVKGSFEFSAGLYVNGNKISPVTDGGGGKLYENAMLYLHTKDNIPKGNDVITIVLDTDQTVSSSISWWSSAQIPDNTSDQKPIRIIVTTTGGSISISNQSGNALFQGRNGIVLVIDEGVIFKGSSSYPSEGALIQMMSGGSIIMDGGEIRDHLCQRGGSPGSEQHDLNAGGIRIGGGTNGGYLIMNGGKITNNYAKIQGTPSAGSPNCSAGGVIILQYGVVVINGGEISNNTLDVNSQTLKNTVAGGIAATANNAQRHGNASIFMTGGEIYGNKVINSTAAVGSAGGVYASGTFQKNGGTIYGADAGDSSRRNTTTLTGNKAGAVFISGNYGANPTATAKVGNKDAAATSPSKRENTTGPGDALFIESYKPGAGNAAINFIPDWATSFWDQ